MIHFILKNPSIPSPLCRFAPRKNAVCCITISVEGSGYSRVIGMAQSRLRMAVGGAGLVVVSVFLLVALALFASPNGTQS